MTAIFKRDFDHETETELRRRTGLISEAELAKACQDALEEGERRGRAAAEMALRAEAELLRAQSLSRIREGMDRLLTERERQERELETQLMDFAIAVGEKVMPDLIETRAHQQVISRIRKGLRMGLGSGHIRIQASARDLALIESDLQTIISGLPAPDRVELSASAELAPGDLRVDWDQGGMSYSFTTVCTEILTLLRKSKPAPSGAGRDHIITNKESRS
jgi:flagellar assembly protein FliH